MKYIPKVGCEFDISAESLRLKQSFLQERTRTVIALTVLAGCVIALLAAAISGAQGGDYNGLLKVWAVVSAPITAILTYYFRGTRQGVESDD
jgi:hypothetical protein